MGCNESGKTTLFKMIMNREEGVSVSSQVKIGFFRKDSFVVKDDMTVFDYMNKESRHNESNLRRMLASIGFFQEDIHKNLSVLSGGELVKLRLCKLMSEAYNVLILDEPTNFLDLDSIEVIEQMIQEFEGTVIFSSHDQQLVKSVSDFTLNIIEGKIEMLV